MSNHRKIKELCAICAQQLTVISIQNKIISAQADALAQMKAVCMEEEKAEVDRRIAELVQQVGVLAGQDGTT